MTFGQLLESALVETIKELIFEEWLAEDLEGVTLKRNARHKDENKQQHVWELHHPKHGKLATVKIYSNNDTPMHKTKSAGMCIQSHYNSSAELAGDSGKHTRMGPQYKVGSSTTRRILHHLSKHYPKLESIDDAERITGARAGRDAPPAHIVLKHKKQRDLDFPRGDNNYEKSFYGNRVNRDRETVRWNQPADKRFPVPKEKMTKRKQLYLKNRRQGSLFGQD